MRKTEKREFVFKQWISKKDIHKSYPKFVKIAFGIGGGENKPKIHYPKRIIKTKEEEENPNVLRWQLESEEDQKELQRIIRKAQKKQKIRQLYRKSQFKIAWHTIKLSKIQQWTSLFRKFQRYVRAENNKGVILTYSKLKELQKTMQFRPVSRNREINKPYLTKNEAKLLNQIRSKLPNEFLKSSTPKSINYVIRCKRCEYTIFADRYPNAIEEMITHYCDKHNGNFAEDILITKVNENYLPLTENPKFWEKSVRGKRLSMITLAEFEEQYPNL